MSGVAGAAASGRWGWTRQFEPGSRRGLAMATVAVVALAVLVSLLRGQDTNWDLRNYHLYNAWAWLNGRIATDLAPAQLQSYFTPLLDVPYYLLVQHAPAPVAGVFLGILHGLAFLPLCWIAWRILAGEQERGRKAFLLALAGMCGGAFLSELGNTMGDASTAALVLGALALALPSAGGWASRTVALAGALLGTAVALKLTNALYAVALGLAVLAAPLPWRVRLRALAVLVAMSLLAFALLAGPWFYRVWNTFGNPLFPQFNSWFQAPLAAPVSVSDTRWLPKGLGQALVWPLRLTFEPRRFSEIALPQLAWAVLYIGGIAAAIRWLVRRLRGQGAGAATVTRDPARVMLVVYLVAGFVVWTGVFSIHRYLAALELLAPLTLWLLLHHLLPERVRLRKVLMILCLLVPLVGWNDWGHAGWARKAARIEAPERFNADTILVLGDAPNAWRLPFLPAGPAYVGVASNFPESDAYRAQVRSAVAEGGQAMLLLSAEAVARREQIARKDDKNAVYNRLAGWLMLDRGSCPALRWAARRSSSRTLVEAGQSPSGRCLLAMISDPEVATEVGAVELAERERLREVGGTLAKRYGLVLDVEGCRTYGSWLGTDPYPYQLCPVALQR